MNDFSGPIDKKTAKTLLKLCRKTIPVMTLMDAYAIQAHDKYLQKRKNG